MPSGKANTKILIHARRKKNAASSRVIKPFSSSHEKFGLHSRPNAGVQACELARTLPHICFGSFMRVRATPFCLIGLLLLLPFGGGRGQEAPPSEYRLKAAFIFNFAKFVEWPTSAFADAKSPFVIGVLGENPFGTDLEATVRGKSINEHPIVVKACPNLEEARATHILFVSTTEKKRFEEIFKSLRGTSVLTVGETERFTESGGLINFVSENNKIRFQINDPGAKAAGLKISSKLLSLAVPASR